YYALVCKHCKNSFAATKLGLRDCARCDGLGMGLKERGNREGDLPKDMDIDTVAELLSKAQELTSTKENTV
ncbi:hypothetical protein KIPB_011795, partial [Kipferlia bialata]